MVSDSHAVHVATEVKGNLDVDIHVIDAPCVCVCRYVFLEGQSSCSMQAFRASTLGRWVTHCLLNILETVRMVPQVNKISLSHYPPLYMYI